MAGKAKLKSLIAIIFSVLFLKHSVGYANVKCLVLGEGGRSQRSVQVLGDTGSSWASALTTSSSLESDRYWEGSPYRNSSVVEVRDSGQQRIFYRRIQVPPHRVQAVLSPNQNFLAVLTLEQELKIWPIARPEGLGDAPFFDGQTHHTVLKGLNGKTHIQGLSWSPDGRFLVYMKSHIASTALRRAEFSNEIQFHIYDSRENLSHPIVATYRSLNDQHYHLQHSPLINWSADGARFQIRFLDIQRAFTPDSAIFGGF